MALQTIDFQGLLQQHVGQIIQEWQQHEVPEDIAQFLASQLFQMGMIGAEQMMASPQIEIENAPAPVDITEAMAERIIVIFVHGLSSVYLQWYQSGVPKQEGLEIIQNTALYVFEQSKQMTVAALSTPENSENFSEPQMIQWLSQTSTEAFQFYLNELEKQRGQIPKTGLMSQTQPLDEVVNVDEPPLSEEPMLDTSMVQQEMPQESQPVSQHVTVSSVESDMPEAIYAVIASALVVSSFSEDRRQQILSAFSREEQQQLAYYQDVSQIPPQINFKKLAQYVKKAKLDLKSKLAQFPSPPSVYRRRINQLITQHPSLAVKNLFFKDRGLIQNYLSQFEMQVSASKANGPVLSPGVMQNIFEFLKKQVA